VGIHTAYTAADDSSRPVQAANDNGQEMNTDRRDIAPFLLKYFPDMARASSNEWHFFLDNVCGLETPMELSNGEAFDRWRDKLARIGYPVQKYTAADIANMKAKAEAMAQAEKARAASIDVTQKALATEAPNWPAAEVLASKKGKKK
jgi:hypothetical protein